MKKNLLSKFKKSAVTMIVEGISEFDNEKVITKVLGSKKNKVHNKSYENGNTSQDILASKYSLEKIIKCSEGNVCFIK